MSTGAPMRTWVRSVSFMSAEIQSLLPIRPTALVVVKADMAEITRVPGCRLIHLAHRAVEGRAHHGMVELALGFVHRGLGLQIVGRLFRRQVGIAVQLGQLGGRGLLQRGQRGLRH